MKVEQGTHYVEVHQEENEDSMSVVIRAKDGDLKIEITPPFIADNPHYKQNVRVTIVQPAHGGAWITSF